MTRHARRLLNTALDLAVGVIACRIVGHDATWVPRDGRMERRCRLCGKLTATREAS